MSSSNQPVAGSACKHSQLRERGYVDAHVFEVLVAGTTNLQATTRLVKAGWTGCTVKVASERDLLSHSDAVAVMVP